MSHLGFRRICTVCRKPIDWEAVGGSDNWEGRFFHLIDRSSLCEGASVDLETKEFPDELAIQLGKMAKKEFERKRVKA